MEADSALALAIVLALTHLFAYRLVFLSKIPRSYWLSFGSGISLAYVFLVILPELGEGERTFWYLTEVGIRSRHPYYLSLIGLVLFYGLERLAVVSIEGRADQRTSQMVYWVHMLSYSVYNFIIGYILQRQEYKDWAAGLSFLVVFMLHFIVNDFGLQLKHRESYLHRGRWLLSTMIFAGALAGDLFRKNDEFFLGVQAFVAGAVILNSLKEELPEYKKSRVWALFLGVAIFVLAHSL